MNPFPLVLFEMISAQAIDDKPVVSWIASGDKFVILDRNLFISELVPSYYKHNSWKSFQRQLNLYGFKSKVYHNKKEKKSSRRKKKQNILHHRIGLFHRDKPELLELIDLKYKRENNMDVHIIPALSKAYDKKWVIPLNEGAPSYTTKSFKKLYGSREEETMYLNSGEHDLSKSNLEEESYTKHNITLMNDLNIEFTSFFERPWKNKMSETEGKYGILEDFFTLMENV